MHNNNKYLLFTYTIKAYIKCNHAINIAIMIKDNDNKQMLQYLICVTNVAS